MCSSLPKIYVIDGNIGAGKSEVLKHIRAQNYCVFEEPIALWEPLLELCQQDRPQWAFTFQLFVLAHFHRVRAQARRIGQPFIFMERCTASSLAFIQASQQNNDFSLEECKQLYDIAQMLFVKADRVFFLDESPEVCLSRIRRRGRRGEETLSLAYLKQLQQNYDHLYSDQPRTLIKGLGRSSAEVAAEILTRLKED